LEPDESNQVTTTFITDLIHTNWMDLIVALWI
jgi:hypothetical protein